MRAGEGVTGARTCEGLRMNLESLGGVRFLTLKCNQYISIIRCLNSWKCQTASCALTGLHYMLANECRMVDQTSKNAAKYTAEEVYTNSSHCILNYEKRVSSFLSKTLT